jgi:hypothetical protein
MAKALQCTSCGATTRIDALADGATFQRETCGQVMKVPPGLAGRSSGGRAPAPAPAPAGAPGASSSDAPASAVAPADAPPAPRRRSRPAVPVAAAAPGVAGATGAPAVGGGTAVLTPGDPAPPGPAPAPSRSARGATGSGGAPRDDRRDALPLWMRILIWVIALPVALAIVGIPARQLGYLTSQKLLDVIVKTDLSRFVPILVIIVLWALVTAVLVTASIEGGHRLLQRRRDRATDQGQMSALDSPSEKRGLLGRRKK